MMQQHSTFPQEKFRESLIFNPVKMPKAKVNQIEIAYEISGQGIPLVLIHGHPFDHTMWKPQLDAFSAQYQVITPDLRGYGKSGLADPAKTRFEDYATDIICLMDFFKIESFHLCGLSFGGQVIMEMFRQSPQRIKTLIFADTFAGPDTSEVKQGRYQIASRLEKEGMGAYADEVIGKMITPAHVTWQPEVAEHVLKMMKGTPPVGAASALRARSERINYLAEVLPKINIPTLVIVGRFDEYTPVAVAEELQENLQNCKLIIIEDAAHLPNLEQPEQFNSAVLNFLGQIDLYPLSSF